MTALAELMAERGYPLSALYPATMTIYRSLGREIAGHRHEAVLPSRALSVPLQIANDVRPANSGRWDLTVRAGEGRLSRYRTVAPSPSPAGSSHAGRPPLALGARGLAALYAGTPVATLRRAGTLILADGGSQDADAVLDGAFAATPFMLDGF
jgi:hypothetical protein